MLPAQCPKPREAQGIGSESFSRRGLLSSHQSGQMSVRGGGGVSPHACLCYGVWAVSKLAHNSDTSKTGLW